MHAIAQSGVRTHVRESALKVDSGRKIPFRTGEWSLHQWSAGRTLCQLSYIPAQLKVLVSIATGYNYYSLSLDKLLCLCKEVLHVPVCSGTDLNSYRLRVRIQLRKLIFSPLSFVLEVVNLHSPSPYATSPFRRKVHVWERRTSKTCVGETNKQNMLGEGRTNKQKMCGGG